MREITLLGHIVDESGIHVDREREKAIEDMTPPTDSKEVRRFLGIKGYYRDLIPAYAEKASSLVQLVRKSEPFVWTEERDKAFKTLKGELLSDHCVAYPRPELPYNLYTDASGYALGAVLTQAHEDGKERAVAYISHQFQEMSAGQPSKKRLMQWCMLCRSCALMCMEQM